MAGTALSAISRSSAGSRAGYRPRGRGGCSVMQFFPAIVPRALVTPGDTDAGPPPPLGEYNPVQKAVLTAALAAPGPSPAAC